MRLREAAGGRHVAPHTAYVAALWAVLSRMRKPQIERFPSTLAEVIGRLAPLDKVALYSTGEVPEDLSPDRARELHAHIKDLFHESDTYPIYEGRNTIGRFADKQVDIDLMTQESVEQIWCSRQHAVIVFERDAVVVEDLNSLNGTWVNGTRIHAGQPRQL